jgi:hypothetical protein
VITSQALATGELFRVWTVCVRGDLNQGIPNLMAFASSLFLTTSAVSISSLSVMMFPSGLLVVYRLFFYKLNLRLRLFRFRFRFRLRLGLW